MMKSHATRTMVLVAALLSATVMAPSPALADPRQGPGVTVEELSKQCAFVSQVEILTPGKEWRGYDPETMSVLDLPAPIGSGGGTDLLASFPSKTFTSSSPWYNATDANSSFTAQATFTAGIPIAFGFKISPALQAIAAGPTTTALATRTPPNCSYSKPGVSVSYLFHWSCRSHTPETSYRINGTWQFPVANRGTARVTWVFNYIIYTRIGLGGK